MKQYFKVSQDWMRRAGRGDVAHAFEVVGVEHNDGQPEYDVLTLKTAQGNWNVFRMRGSMVKPYTLMANGSFIEVVGIADDLPRGAHAFTFHQFDTKAEAQAAAAELNDALHLVKVAETKTAAIETVRKGSTVRRLWANGLPMGKAYTVDAFDKTSDCYALLDGKGGVYWLKRGKLVALD